MKEVWRDIPEFPGRYQASNLGRIRNWKGRVRKTLPNWNGYHILSMGRGVTRAVHRLVAAAFHGPCPKGKECAHLNGIKADNRPINLVYVTRKENHSHKKLHGTQQHGDQNGNSKLTSREVRWIKGQLKTGKVTMAWLARHLNVSHTTVWGIKNNKTWTHII